MCKNIEIRGRFLFDYQLGIFDKNVRFNCTVFTHYSEILSMKFLRMLVDCGFRKSRPTLTIDGPCNIILLYNDGIIDIIHRDYRSLYKNENAIPEYVKEYFIT